MTVKFFGSRAGSNRFSGTQGIGVEHLRTDPAWAGGTGKAGEIACIAVGELHSGELQQGYGFQAIGGSVKIAFSCINTTRLTEPGISTAAVWGNEITLTTADITFVDNLVFTAIRVTFVGAATLNIVAR